MPNILQLLPHTKAAFDARVLASVCFFATDIHSATLGKGKKDDSLERVRKGDLTGKGELVVRQSWSML
jgi:carboxymethylenebutenolidase